MRKNYNLMLVSEGNAVNIILSDGIYDSGSTFSEYLHTHHYYELFFVERGKLTVVFAERTLFLSPGDILVIQPEVLHYTESGDSDMARYAFELSFDEKGKPDGSLQRLFGSDTPFSVKNCDEIKVAFARLRAYYESGHSEKKQLMTSCLHEILYLCKEIYEQKERAISDNTYSNRESREFQIESYMSLNFAGDPSLDQLSQMLFLSNQQTNRVINQMYGRSFRKQIVYLRMKNAARLLETTKLKVTDIAEMVGYSSFHGFYGAFIKAFSVTPMEYRGNRQKNKSH